VGKLVVDIAFKAGDGEGEGVQSEGEGVGFVGEGAAEVVLYVANCFVDYLTAVTFGAEEGVPFAVEDL